MPGVRHRAEVGIVGIMVYFYWRALFKLCETLYKTNEVLIAHLHRVTARL